MFLCRAWRLCELLTHQVVRRITVARNEWRTRYRGQRCPFMLKSGEQKWTTQKTIQYFVGRYLHGRHRQETKHQQLGPRLHLRLPQQHCRQHQAAKISQDAGGSICVAYANESFRICAACFALGDQGSVPVGLHGSAKCQDAKKCDTK